MTPENSYSQMMHHVRQLSALGQIGGILSWDQEVMMPPKGAPARAEQAAALEAVAHEKRTSLVLGNLIGELEGANLSQVEARNLELVKKNYNRSIKIPAALAEELARTTTQAQGVWAAARAKSSFQDFAPSLRKIIKLKREEAACVAENGQSHYDALLADFEPGMTVAVLQPLLENMRPRLSTLRAAIADSTVKQPSLKGPFATDVQMDLARKLADVVGYDWEAGRLDLSVHPFSSGTGGDSRITTRVDEDEPLGCLYSTVHELGHALYEQGVPSDHAFTPVGQHASMGVHESQSRLWENQIGRSQPFAAWFFPHFKAAFGDCGIENADDLYRALNRVETGFIRTEADEVHYNLHVLLRFELERDLISGDLEVDDLEEEWNRRFKRDFGLTVPDAAQGVLQDVHWSVGLFGYFPTYSLGNIYAAQLHGTIQSALPDLDAQLTAGNTAALLGWLREHIHSHGSLQTPDALIQNAVGEPVSSEPLLTYLEEKYSQIFEL